MAQALWRTLRELRMAGVRAEQIPPDAFASPAKHQELRALLTAYETFLATEKRGDMATVYEEAVQHPDWCPIQPQDCWTECPDAPWDPVAAHPDRPHAGRTHRAARVRDRRLDAAAPVCRRAQSNAFPRIREHRRSHS